MCKYLYHKQDGDVMKKIIIAGVFIILIILSCSTVENDGMDNGTITGVDIRECICCGGYFIDIRDSTYRFFDLPAGSNLNLTNAKFPIYVKLDWVKADSTCLGDEIEVLNIKLR